MFTGCGGSSEEEATFTLFPTPPITPTPTPAPATPTPIPTEAPKTTFDYEVQPGDTVGAIAGRFGTTIEAIIEANDLTDPAAITEGDMLTIPDASSTPPPTASPTPTPENPVGTGFVLPIAGACLATSSNLLPNAPREYRFGVHEGMDFYTYDNCVAVPGGTEVLAMKAGTVIRVDHGFVEMTAVELDDLLTRAETQGYTDAEALDRFRGRQVWVDHGGGIVTRYAHLGGIPENIQDGVAVAAGELIAFVGDSGTPEAITAPGIENHAHIEIRVGESFLGEGLPEDQVRYLYEQAFSIP